MNFLSYDLSYYALSALAVLITLTVHEYAHAYAAYKMGDPTAKNIGRLTLNPLKHLDPFGALCMLFFRIGWAKPVPINARNFKNPRRGFAISAFAGPLTNLIVAFFSAPIILVLYRPLASLLVSGNYNDFTFNLIYNTLLFFEFFYSVNIGIALFNLIPVPPLDGSRILGLLLPPKHYFAIMRHERTIYYVLLGWLFVGDLISDAILSLPFIASNQLLAIPAFCLSLSNILAFLRNGLSELIIGFWSLLPIF